MEDEKSVHSVVECYHEGQLIAIIGEEDTLVGFLIAGIGQRTDHGEVNFAVVEHDASTEEVMSHMLNFIIREDIAIILVTFEAASKIKKFILSYKSFMPVILEIPSKYHIYNPEEDEVMKRLISKCGSGSDEHLDNILKNK